MSIKNDNITTSLSRRAFIRTATMLIGGAYVLPSAAFESNASSSKLSNEKIDYLCCMQLTYNMSINAKLRRETSELYGNLDNADYRKKLVDMYYIPSSEIKISGKSYHLSKGFAEDLASRSGSSNAEKVVSDILGRTAMITSFAGVEAGTVLENANPASFSMEEQNTLIHVLWKMAFNNELSVNLKNAESVEDKIAILKTIETDFGYTLSTPVASTIAEYLVEENYSALSEVLGNNIYAASW